MATPTTTSGTPPPVAGDVSSAGAPAAAAPVIPTKSVGITGTANYGGDILAESNARLTYESAYGQPGSRSWGEWEELVRTDAAVAAGLDFVCGPIRDARVDVEPADDTPEEQAIADFVRWNLTEALEPTFPEFLTQATKGMLGCGFSLFEPTMRQAQHELLPGGTGYVVDKVAQRLPSTVAHNAWLETPDGSELRAVKQQGPRGSKWETVEVPADRLLLFTWQRTGNNYAGFSAFRAVWYPAQIRKELLRLVGVTYQREGAGVPVMEATDKTAELTPGQRTQMETLLANLVYHENASLIPPAGWTLDWKFSGGANKGHVLDAYHRLGVYILEQVQAQQLSLGTGDTGSRSVGTVHDASARAFIQSVTALIESVLNGVGSRPYTGLVRRLVVANWGVRAEYPKVRLTLKQAQMSPLEKLTAMKTAIDAKALTVTIDDENAVRESLGLSPIDEAARDEERERKAALAPPSPFGAPGGVQPKQTEEVDGAPEGKSLQASAPRKQWVPWRALRASEAKLKLAEMDAYFTAQRDEYEAQARSVIAVMMGSAAPQVAAAMKDGVVSPEEVAAVTFNTKRLEKLNRAFLEKQRKTGADFLAGELGRSPALLRAAEGEPEDPEAVTEEADAVLDAQANALLRRQMARARGELEREAIDAQRTGDDADAVVQRALESQLDSGAFRTDAGSVLTKAFNVGRDEAARILGGVATVELSAILDSATCEACVSLDGATAEFGSAEHDRLVPPVRDCAGRDNCRCLLTYQRGDL